MIKAPVTSILLVALIGLTSIGCGKGSAPTPAEPDKLAQSDPNARGQQLLNEFASAEDPNAWVQQNSFALTVFEKVTDANLKQQYDAKIAPLLAQQPR